MSATAQHGRIERRCCADRQFVIGFCFTLQVFTQQFYPLHATAFSLARSFGVIFCTAALSTENIVTRLKTPAGPCVARFSPRNPKLPPTMERLCVE